MKFTFFSVCKCEYISVMDFTEKKKEKLQNIKEYEAETEMPQIPIPSDVITVPIFSRAYFYRTLYILQVMYTFYFFSYTMYQKHFSQVTKF